METEPHVRPPICQRRNGRRMAYANGAIWAAGNGLVSSTLVIYLAMELGVPGVGAGIGLIKAAPRLAGLLRVAAPALIAATGSRKRFCLSTYLASTVVLFCLPLVTAPGRLPTASASLVALILLWCVYHLLEYLGTVALWSWLADLVPLRIRGRFIGRRNRWLVAGQAVGMLSAGLFTWWWHTSFPHLPRWVGYAFPAGAGAGFMAASLVPLAWIPSLERRPTDSISAAQRRAASPRPSLLAPLADWRYRRLLLFVCWFSLANGLTQSAQYIFLFRVLGVTLLVFHSLQMAMRLGQYAVSPWAGGLADRWGNRPVMAVSLLLTSAALLFYCVATPQQPGWIVGAWALWVAYAGLNIGLPNLMLKLAPKRENTAYIATLNAASGLSFAVGALVGGSLYDQFHEVVVCVFGGALTLDYYGLSFLGGFVVRSLGVLMLLLVVVEAPPRAE